jgi:hypothetical protein
MNEVKWNNKTHFPDSFLITFYIHVDVTCSDLFTDFIGHTRIIKWTQYKRSSTSRSLHNILVGISSFTHLYSQTLLWLKLHKLWVWILLMVSCTWYNIMWSSLSVTCSRSVVFSTNKTAHHDITEILLKVVKHRNSSYIPFHPWGIGLNPAHNKWCITFIFKCKSCNE